MNSSTFSTIALIFDFDDTLVPDSTTKLLKQCKIDPQKFWKKDAKALIYSGFDPALAYLKLLLENIGPRKPLGQLTNAELCKFGKTLDPLFYDGIPELIRDLKNTVKRYKNIAIEFYVISGGLQEIIEGSELIKKNFSGVYGSQLVGDTKDGVLKYIKRCVTFTEKTRYLFEINKGLDPKRTRRNPYLVNKDIAPHNRKIPFKNMIFVGDGLTDIPCFSLLKKEGGTTFGVFDPGEKKSAKRALLEFLKTDRVISMHAPKYGKGDELGSFLRVAVAARCSKIKLERQEAEP